MSTTDILLTELVGYAKSLQQAIDWVDDHREVIDKCNHANAQHYEAIIYLSAGRQPVEIAKALGEKWNRVQLEDTIYWAMQSPKIGAGINLWDAEAPVKESDEVKL